MSEQKTLKLDQWAESNGLPDAGTTELRGNIDKLLSKKKLSAAAKYTQISEAVVEELEKRGEFYFHSLLKDFDSAMYFDAKRKTLQCVRSDEFQSWLSVWTSVNRASTLFPYIMKGVETAALSGPSTTGIIPEHYWASRPGAFYMSNGDGGMIKIIAGLIDEVENGTDDVLFAAGKTLQPWKLVQSIDPFEACRVFRDANFTSEHSKPLLKAWMISLPTNPKCKPPLVFTGDIGAGKTRIAKGIAELYGIPQRIVKAEEKGESDFWPAVNDGGIYTLDNADTYVKWLPDTLAAAVTAGSSCKRRLYTNGELVDLKANSWIIVTSANPSFAGDAGLADRLLVARMARRTGNTSDEELSREIAANRDAGLSFIANYLGVALADTAPTPEGLNSRHPDFASFAVRIGRTLGQEEQIISALKAAEADKSTFCLENDPIATAVMGLVNEHVENVGIGAEISETASEFVSHLQEYDYKSFEHLTPRKFSTTMKKLWPHLEHVLKATKETKHGGFLNYTFGLRD